MGSVGLPLPEIEVKIANPDKDGIGEIIVRGPNVMKGYYKNPEETAMVLKDGWFFTGDLGYRDKNGYIYITGRAKEVIVLSSGKNIYPEEIEKHYLKSPIIKEICILGIGKRPDIAEEIKAVIVPNTEYMKENGIANFNEAVVGARISKSGNAIPQQGDFIGKESIVNIMNNETVKIIIDSKIP